MYSLGSPKNCLEKELTLVIHYIQAYQLYHGVHLIWLYGHLSKDVLFIGMERGEGSWGVTYILEEYRKHHSCNLGGR